MCPSPAKSLELFLSSQANAGLHEKLCDVASCLACSLCVTLVELFVQATVEQMEAILTAAIHSSDSDRQQQLQARVLDATRLRFALFAVKPGHILSLGRASMIVSGSYQGPAKPRLPTHVLQVFLHGWGCLLLSLHRSAQALPLHGTLILSFARLRSCTTTK